jgi:hypothetical protein
MGAASINPTSHEPLAGAIFLGQNLGQNSDETRQNSKVPTGQNYRTKPPYKEVLSVLSEAGQNLRTKLYPVAPLPRSVVVSRACPFSFKR